MNLEENGRKAQNPMAYICFGDRFEILQQRYCCINPNTLNSKNTLFYQNANGKKLS